MDIGERIVSARKSHGWSQLDLAGEMGVAQSTVANWERGARALNIKTAQSVLGHKDMQMTMDYADTTREDVKLARAPMADALSVPEPAEVRKIG